MTALKSPEPDIAVVFRAPCGNIGAALFSGAIRHVFRREGRRAASISCAVVGDAEIRELNRRFLRHDYPTDIITFPLEEDPIEAELVISAETARRQAREYGVTMRDEYARLAIHGSLHLCGYDDRTDDDRAAMKAREDHYLSQYMQKYRTDR